MVSSHAKPPFFESRNRTSVETTMVVISWGILPLCAGNLYGCVKLTLSRTDIHYCIHACEINIFQQGFSRLYSTNSIMLVESCGSQFLIVLLAQLPWIWLIVTLPNVLLGKSIENTCLVSFGYWMNLAEINNKHDSDKPQ